ncbi:hypothetical protein MUK42_07647 [Musa troglodytarum]|uniref:Uncharacterized protein n=1 Tax=Musa troglodytarum TaxID=320322 RepID=A0A9E7GD63_9LILI|nr:hypothetical protein MUK42_07647 [Musa troglodytarum]
MGGTEATRDVANSDLLQKLQTLPSAFASFPQETSEIAVIALPFLEAFKGHWNSILMLFAQNKVGFE